MLLTAAVAGFLAWANLAWQKSRPYQRTAIPESLSTLNDVQAICKSLGHNASSYSAGGGGSGGMHSTTRSYDCHIDLPKDLHGPFMAAYRQHVKGVLDKHAAGVYGAGSTSGGGGLRGFEYQYDRGSTQGTVIVRSVGSEQELALMVFVHEQDAPP